MGKNAIVNHAAFFRDVRLENSAAVDDYQKEIWEDCSKRAGAAFSLEGCPLQLWHVSTSSRPPVVIDVQRRHLGKESPILLEQGIRCGSKDLPEPIVGCVAAE